MQQGWLLTIEKKQDAVDVGDSWGLWTDAPHDQGTGNVRRRSDGQPYTPMWGPGDAVVTYHPESGRCVAFLEILSEPDWDESRKLFWLQTRVDAWTTTGGPSLTAIGVDRALQGGRHRLSPEQLDLAKAAFNG